MYSPMISSSKYSIYPERERLTDPMRAVVGVAHAGPRVSRWRGIILASPQRLHLQITCNPMRPVKASLDIWPPFPIAMDYSVWHFLGYKYRGAADEENVIAALEHRDRISDIHVFDLTRRRFERLFPAMLEPFPALTILNLSAPFSTPPALLPGTFLGGYVPRLRSFTLRGIAFPTLPKFVLRATHIVTLHLLDMPSSEYMCLSPEAMATCLLALPNLETLSIGFELPPLIPRQTTVPARPALTHAVLPSLRNFIFGGISGYLEDFIARIDTPLLDQLEISFSSDFISATPQLHQFVGHAQSLRPLNHAQVKFSPFVITITLGSPAHFLLEICYYKGPDLLSTVTQLPDRLLSSVREICNDRFSYLPHVDQLDIYEGYNLELVGNIDGPSQWLEILRPFSSVRSLRVSKKLEPLVAAALRELTGERTMEVLPALESISLDELESCASARDAEKTASTRNQFPILILRWVITTSHFPFQPRSVFSRSASVRASSVICCGCV